MRFTNAMAEEFVNKVAQSGIITINLEDDFDKHEIVVFDIKDNLFQGLMLREKDFREFVKEHDWEQYRDKNVSIICSADAIVPTWAYMLLVNKLSGIANFSIFGNKEQLITALYMKAFAKINPEDYNDARVVIKGCGDYPVPIAAYTEITRLLTPHVKSLMYGEPCSTVPIYKKKKEAVEAK